MDSEILWRVTVVQLASVVALSLVLGLLLPGEFFDDWGWLSGPTAWLICAWFTAWVVGLEPGPVVVRALGAGLVSMLFVIAGLHWLGVVIAIGLFAALCARLPRPVADSSP
ncbi:MAG: hypothetical protein WD827_03985 [Solirubrobacterales bacterium]